MGTLQQIQMTPQLAGENVGTLLLARREELGSKLCFRSIEEKNAGKNENVCVKIRRLFLIFCVCKK